MLSAPHRSDAPAAAPATELRRCMQCWQHKALEQFRRKRGPGYAVQCLECRGRYGGWDKMSAEERDAARRPRRGLRAEAARDAFRVGFNRRSGNAKTGRMPVSLSSSETCPPSCAFFGQGCFAEYHMLRSHWSRVPERGLTWGAFLATVEELPAGTLWRHNEAGDLPGLGDALDVEMLLELVSANLGRRGFTFTHKPLRDARELAAVRVANQYGFTVNLSADTLEDADRLADLDAGPVAVVLPERGERTTTPAGRTVVVCPAETAGITCLDCGLCAKPWRRAIVGFRAHGQMKARVEQLVQLRRKETP